MIKAISFFKFKPFSIKQIKVLTWWADNSPVKDKNGIIADGAIRSGKTLSMSLSFVLWAMERYVYQNFGMCGKTIGSFRRNVLFWLKLMLRSRGYKVSEYRADNYITIMKNGIMNYFYIFGGKDERSQDLIQGITLAGCFFDEVALMPESFVNQATGRCSVDGSTFWFNCNPDAPNHWFNIKWIKKHKELGLLYLHFTMDDNLSLSEKIKERYRQMYNGVFFDRFIRGLWVLAEGLIYPNTEQAIVPTEERNYIEYQISCDYGIHNPTCFGLFGLYKGVWYMIKEYYHSGRDTNQPKTDEEYYRELEQFAGDLPIKRIIVDPSAASFITLIRRKGRFIVRGADNAVVDGIRSTSAAINIGIIKINDCCNHIQAEFKVYAWDERASEDKPIKENDHMCDLLRYYVYTNKLSLPKQKGLRIK